MKKISSKRPLRSSSGGRASMRLAVATTKTGAVFSWSQVRSDPKTRAETPPSDIPDDWEPESPFSISSTHSTTGATLSATRMARRRFSSEEPMSPLKMRPMSSRRSGSRHWPATALAVRLLPQPCTPRSRSPLGSGRPKARAFSEKAAPRRTSQVLRCCSPPTWASPWSAEKYSSSPLLRITCRFSSSTSGTSSRESRPSLAMALAKALSASARVSPRAAWTSWSASSRVSSTLARLFRRTTSTISLRSSSRSR